MSNKLSEKELIQSGKLLVRELNVVLSKYWKDHKGLPMEQVFYINTNVVASLVAHITFLLFKKNIGTEKQLSYIDSVCGLAKRYLKAESDLFINEVKSNDNIHSR